MLRLLLRVNHASCRAYSQTAAHRTAPAAPKSFAIEQLEREGARILKTVQRRVAERHSLLSQVSEDMSSPNDIKFSKQAKELEPLDHAWQEWKRNRELLVETTSLLNDPDPAMRALASEEHTQLTDALSTSLSSTFPALLVPPSTTAHLSAIIDIKSGVGGSEASLFLGDLLRVYLRYAQDSRWKADIVTKNESDNGGIKDAVVEVRGPGAYDALRWESGVHRVQRVPATETKGRVHTSTVAVIVLPLVEETAGEAEELFSMDDVRIEVMRARGAGGQHVNKTESAVRLTHKPTGITVSMQDERSQHQNRRRAFQVLRARLLDRKITEDMVSRRSARRDLVKTADRSEKIRTYNYAQERVTDHRLGLSLMNLTAVMEEDGLHEFIAALQRDYDEGIMEDLIADGA
ncbi:hypothetical protein HWV62_3306 [Athelia sp. TMB]|nr:hypothetical protein HWV62_3306 [Athelia sp. TMB]